MPPHRNNLAFLKPTRRKPTFCLPLLEIIERSKNVNRATPSEMIFKAPSEKLVNRGSVDIKWNGPYLVMVPLKLQVRLYMLLGTTSKMQILFLKYLTDI